MLREEGYDVVGEAPNGQVAVELTESLGPDLVIMDIKMPVRDGIDAASEIAAKRLAPVVMLTAFSQRDFVEKARDAGAMAYLVKPFTKADLVPAIEVAVSRYQEVKSLESEVATMQDRLGPANSSNAPRAVDGEAEPQRTRGVQVDPAGSDGPPHHHEGRRAGCGRNPGHAQLTPAILD